MSLKTEVRIFPHAPPPPLHQVTLFPAFQTSLLGHVSRLVKMSIFNVSK
uniref:Uncharacterized protein n=1 Tax=Anguilla anguilla TaxID=7936 RepID=A0A0E9XHL3_ANGAN